MRKLEYLLPITINATKPLIYNIIGSIVVMGGIIFVIYAVTTGRFTDIAELIIYLPIPIMTVILLIFHDKLIYKYIFDEDKIILYKLFGKKIIYKENITRITNDTLDKGDQIDIHYKFSSKDYTKIISIHRGVGPKNFDKFYNVLKDSYNK